MPARGSSPTPLCRLALAAGRGDRRSLGRLLRELQDVLWRFCLSQLGDRQEAEEAVQETASRIVAGVASFTGASTARTWAIGVALNVCRERRRRRTHTNIDDTHQPLDRHPTASDTAVLAEETEQLRAVLPNLPDRQREAIVLRYFEQLSVQETADAMGCTPGAVKATVWQALRRLRKQLASPQEAQHG